MPQPIVVGVDGRDQSRDAIALAASLARATGAEVVLAHVHPYDPLAGRRVLGAPGSSPLADEAREILVKAAADAPDNVRVLPVAAGSPAHGLHAAAEELDASMIVVGSSHRSGLGRVLLGSDAESAIAGAPCAVAVAPRGLAGREWSIGSIAVGFDGGDEAQEALQAARELASATGAKLRLVGVVSDAPPIIWGPYAYVPDWPEVQRAQLQELQRRLDAAAGGAETELRSGDVVDELDAVSQTCDLLVLGSRGYGPVRRVLLGGTANLVVRAAASPVLVVPRSATGDDANVTAEADEATGAPS